MINYRKKTEAVLCLLLVLSCLYTFKEIVIEGHRLIGDDFILFYLGMKKFLYSELHTYKAIPFWNPYIFGGMPFWAHFESTIFYPLGILFWFITPDKAYGYTMFGHLALAGIFMYILVRSVGIGISGSFVAATIFMGNGFVMALLYLGHMCPIQSYIWLPLILYFLNVSTKSEKPYFYGAMAGAIWGFQILAGAPQDAFYTFLASILFLLCRLSSGPNNRHSWGKILGIVIFMFLIGSGLSAIQTVPAFELINQSVRSSLDSFQMVTQGSYPPEGIITVLMPHFFGNYARGGFWVGNVPWSIPQQNLYVGIVPAALIFFIKPRYLENKRTLIFATTLAVLAFTLALGRHSPLYKLAYMLPGFDRFRAPSKIIVLWAFALALLSAYGMEHLLRRHKRATIRKVLFYFSVIIAFIMLDLLFHLHPKATLSFFSPFILDSAIPGKPFDAEIIICDQFHHLTLFLTIGLTLVILKESKILKPRLIAVALCGLVLLDLALTNEGVIRHNDALYEYIDKTKRELDASLGQDKSLFRVGSFKCGMGPNFEMILGYQTVGGFTALFPNRYYDYINRYSDHQLSDGWVSFHYGVTKNNIFMDLLNVKYEIIHSRKTYSIRKTCLPRALIVPHCKVLERGQILDYMASPKFNPTRTVLFETGEVKSELPDFNCRDAAPPTPVKFITYRPDNILCLTDSSYPAYLLLSEIFYPGWKAFVDDKPVPIFRGNYLFRVIKIPKGRHSVRLVFDPLYIKIGIGITVFILFMLVNLTLYHYRHKLPSSLRYKM